MRRLCALWSKLQRDHLEPQACDAPSLRKLYFILSEIFRRYLEKRFGFPALDWTSEEIIKWSESDKRFDPATHAQMSRLLKRTDLIKFARAHGFLDLGRSGGDSQFRGFRPERRRQSNQRRKTARPHNGRSLMTFLRFQDPIF